MKYKYVSVFLLVLILAIGAVSAQDNVTDADVISTASDDVISVDSNVNTLQNESGSQEIHLNNANFANYFDENGTMNDNVANDTTIYVGDITNKSMYINKMVTILPDNVSNVVDSTFNFIGGSAYSNIKNITITNDFQLAIVVIDAEFINVWDNTINILGYANSTGMAITTLNATYINIGGNKINYNGKNDGLTPTNAIAVLYSDNAYIGENIMNITMPSAPVIWDEMPPYASIPLTEAIVITSSNDVIFEKNKINLKASDKIGQYDTIYVVDIKDSNNTIVEGNAIEAFGHSYIYGIIISGQNFNVTCNDVLVNSDEYYANGIDVEGPAAGVVKENNFTVLAPTAAYGIYSAMSNGDVNASYTENVIEGDAYAVYGMELAGNLEFVVDNEFYLTGNYTTGIASKSKSSGIARNDIKADGSSIGNESFWDAFAPNTVGINLYNTIADVYENTILSNSVGMYIEGGEESIFEGNDIIVNDNGQKNSTAFHAEGVNGINFTNNYIQYYGGTEGETLNTVMAILDSNNTSVSENEIYGYVVSLPFDWVENPDGGWEREAVSYGLVFYDDDSIEIFDNNISVMYFDYSGVDDTIYALEVDSPNALIENNNITAFGHSYIYGIVISGDEFTVASNNINSTSDTYYANGIDVEGPATGVVENNTITAEAPTVAYPVYSAMSNGNVTVDYMHNIINALAHVVYGMELAGDMEAVINNTITVNGNFTTAIAAKTNDINIHDNTIIANGTNLGNTTIWDAFAVSTMGINLYNSTAFVYNNTIESTSNGVYAEGGEAMFLDNNIRVDDDGQVPSSGIAAIDMRSIDLLGNSLWYVGQTNGTNKNVAVRIEQCNNTTIEKNDIYANIVACDVIWEPDADGNWVGHAISSGIELNDCDGIEVSNNNLTVAFGSYRGVADTIYAVDVDSNNALIDGNTIKGHGYSYIYALQMSGENFTVSNNDIYALAESHYANGINVEGPSSGVVENNTITAEAPVVAYPVYSSMSGNQVIADYIDNVINGEADIVYGMELAGTNESAHGNTITVKGNKTTGIAGKSENLIIVDNKIEALGENLGNTTLWEAFVPETTGVKIIGGNATVEKNNIKANGAATVNITDVNATVVYNYLVGNETFGDASVYFEGESAEVHDNLPEFDAFLHTENVVMYYKNGTRFVVNVTDFYGRPLDNESVTFLINNMTYNRVTDANGTASIAINLEAGNYTILTTLWPAGNFTPIQETNNITVLTTILGDDLVKMFRNATQYSATFLDGQGNPLVGVGAIFNINGVMYTRTTDSKGVASLNINLDPGQYVITAYNPNNGEAHANLITVLSPIQSSDLVKYYRNESQFVVTIYGKDGKVVGAGENVTFNINGVFYTRTTNESGQVKLNINLQPGNYTITTMYNDCFIGNNVEVLPVLTASDLVMKHGTSDQFIAYLVDGQGKPLEGETVNFNIHGVFYDRVTDADGRAILNIKLSAAADTYIITSSYNGCSISNKIIIKP